jgi:F0F1-type ATP synthase membrane subunit b/b'
LKRALNLTFAALLVAVSLPAAEQARNQAEGSEDHLLPWKVANFALLAGALGYVIYKKGGPFFAARTVSIRWALDDAARASREAQERYAEVERRLASLGAEVENLKTKAREESGAEGERLRAESERAFQKIREQVEQEIAAAAKAARHELRVYAADLAVSLAERRIRERLTPDSESALLGAMLQDLDRRSNAQAARAS